LCTMQCTISWPIACTSHSSLLRQYTPSACTGRFNDGLRCVQQMNTRQHVQA
jgi:hypothetical protein